MCVLTGTEICRLSELKSAQLGITKQLVLHFALPHIGLILATICYAIFGSLCLNFLSQIDSEFPIAVEVQGFKIGFVKKILEARSYRRQITSNEIEFVMAHFNEDLYKIFLLQPKYLIQKEIMKTTDKDYLPSNVLLNIFTAVTTLTSIGYGTNIPRSVHGRIFIIIYVLIGIPLYLITLADLGKFCTQCLMKFYIKLVKKKFDMISKYRRWKRQRTPNDVHIFDLVIAGGDDEIAEFLWMHLENATFVELPFVLIYFILVLYAFITSLLISTIEGWSICDGFYFFMMSILTVGFGDLLPQNDNFIMLTLLLIIAGLIIGSTCIDIAGAYYINRLHFCGRIEDQEDPLSWLKAVQQQRIVNMKREAMRKLFETVTALHHLRLGHLANMQTRQSNCEIIPAILEAPRNLIAYNAAADSVTLHWEAPSQIYDIKYWFTITYKTRTPQRLSDDQISIIDFVNTNKYEVKHLKSFMLYQFMVTTSTKYGSSSPARCQEYTEPCTVPQLIRLTTFSSETATITWKAPKKNNGAESYVLQFSQEPAPSFAYWQRYRCGSSKAFTITDLIPNTRYVVCVSAEHNYGQTAMSRSLRFQTKKYCLDQVSALSVPRSDQ